MVLTHARVQKVKKWSEGSIRGFLSWGGTSTKSLKNTSLKLPIALEFIFKLLPRKEPF